MILRMLHFFSHGSSGIKTSAVMSTDSISYGLEFSISACLPLSPSLPPSLPLSLAHSLKPKPEASRGSALLLSYVAYISLFLVSFALYFQITILKGQLQHQEPE